MKLHTSVKEINTAIESIARRGKILDHDIHRAGVSCIKHAAEHGDTTLLDKLVLAMPQGSRKHAFMEWALAYGNVRALDRGNDADKAAIEQGRIFAKDKSKEYDEAGAIANAWYNFKPEPDLLTAFDVHKAVAQLVKRVSKATKDGTALENIDDALKALESLKQSLSTQTETL